MGSSRFIYRWCVSNMSLHESGTYEKSVVSQAARAAPSVSRELSHPLREAAVCAGIGKNEHGFEFILRLLRLCT